MQYSGLSELVPGYRIANPRPVTLMLIATVGGAGWLVTPRAEHALVPGTLYVGVPGEPVGWGIAGGQWRMVWWYLHPQPRWRAWLTTSGILRQCPSAALLAALVDDLLGRCPPPADNAAPAPVAPLATATADLALRHLHLLATAPDAEPVAPADRFAALWREVAERPQDDWSLPALARRLAVSVSTMQRIAIAHLGKPPYQALTELRLARARDLLRSTTYPVQTVAELVGYRDPFTFSHAFRRWAGMPPSACRGGTR